jgi:hypothetical protein
MNLLLHLLALCSAGRNAPNALLDLLGSQVLGLVSETAEGLENPLKNSLAVELTLRHRLAFGQGLCTLEAKYVYYRQLLPRAEAYDLVHDRLEF